MHVKRSISCLLLAVGLSHMSPHAVSQMRATTITRVFWQDRETQQLSYADVTTTNRWNLKRGWVTGFPALDSGSQSLGSMTQAGGLLGVTVSGTSGGWVAIDAGAYEEPHGNHTHWKYNKLPAVRQSNLKSNNADGSRTFVYDNQMYVTDPSVNGFTKANPSALRYGGSNPTRSFSGGSGQIAIAAVNNAVAYATHSESTGDRAGQVDVVNLLNASAEPEYHFNVGSGGISAATANSGKVFFAHDGGISWVLADTTASKSADSVQVNNVGDTSKTAVRSFANQRNWVMFTDAAASALCLINAASQSPEVIRLPIETAEGLQLSEPSVVLSLGKRYAFVFQEKTDPTQVIQEQLTVIELDPDKNREFSDAKVKLSIPVGGSKISGNDGHHGICFDAYGRHAIITSPADGIVSVLSVQKMAIVAKFQVGGTPDRIMAVGAPEHFH